MFGLGINWKMSDLSAVSKLSDEFKVSLIGSKCATCLRLDEGYTTESAQASVVCRHFWTEVTSKSRGKSFLL